MNDTTLVPRPITTTAADVFEAMAKRIGLNNAEPFGGAFVVFPPANGGEPVQALILDASGSPAQFWSMVLARAQQAIEELDNLQRKQAFGGR